DTLEACRTGDRSARRQEEGAAEEGIREEGASEESLREETSEEEAGAEASLIFDQRREVREERLHLGLRHLLARFLAEVAYFQQLVGNLEEEPRGRALELAVAHEPRARAREVQLALRARDADVAQPALLADVGRVIGIRDIAGLRVQRARV